MNINKIGIKKIINTEEIQNILKEISKSYTPDIISIVNKIIVIHLVFNT